MVWLTGGSSEYFNSTHITDHPGLLYPLHPTGPLGRFFLLPQF